ncbi:MAG: hypothetical protein KC413_09745, partial [Anaerolineales bacterium]|nr:hypothetical protein [Anaerolineales bacterium]
MTHYAVITIPLNRPNVVAFLLPPSSKQKGASIHILAQRPTLAAEAAWINQLTQKPTIESLLAIDRPENHVVQTTTDRLVPVEFFTDDEFLTRSLGSWSPIFFGVAAVPEAGLSDPLLEHLTVLADYGRSIHHFGADPKLVTRRLANEVGASAAETAVFLQRLHQQRPTNALTPTVIANQIQTLYSHIAEETLLQTAVAGPIPKTILLDELMGWMVRQETA